MAKAIMIQGTMSNAGKSLIAAGLCRIFRQDGYHVAPFKSQNMALNSFITQDGLEMGRAQVMQAEAAGITPDVHPGCEWVMKGEGEATVKIDGACCAILGGVFYVRYDAKAGKNGKRKPVPAGAIPCQEHPDPVTGHFPCWVPVEKDNPSQKWFCEAFRNAPGYGLVLYGPDGKLRDHTYEAVGPHFQGNPYHFDRDILLPHGLWKIPELNTSGPRTFEVIRAWLETHQEEGIVFWQDGEPQCKIKRSDFGLTWPGGEGGMLPDDGRTDCTELFS